MLSALFLAILKRAGARAFWIGFLIVGCSYIAFSKLPDEKGYSPRAAGPEFTTRLSVFVFEKLDKSRLEDQKEQPNLSLIYVGGQVVSDDEEDLILGSEGSGEIKDEFQTAESKVNSTTGNGFGGGGTTEQGVTGRDFQPLIDSVWDSGIDVESSSILPYPANVNLIVSYPFYVVGFTRFVATCHYAWALLFGWIAGHLSKVIFERWFCNEGSAEQLVV